MRFSNDRTIASPMWNFIYSINVDRSFLEIFINSASFWRRDSFHVRNCIESTNFSRNSRENSRRACKMCRLAKEIFLLRIYASQQIASILFAKIRSTISIKRSAIFSSRTIRRLLVAIFYRPWKTLKDWNVVETRTGRIVESFVRTHNGGERINCRVETGQFLLSRYNNFSPWKNRRRMKRIPNDPGMEISAIRVIPAVWCTRQWKRVAGEARGS